MHRCHEIVSLHRRSVSSSIRAVRLGNFHRKSPGGKLKWNRLRFTVCSCIQRRKVFQGGGLMHSCRRRRNRLETCLKKKRRNVDQKHRVFYCCRARKKTLHRTRFFEKYSYVPSTAHRWRSSKKNTSPQYEKEQIQRPGTTFSNFSDKVAVPTRRGYENCCRFATL